MGKLSLMDGMQESIIKMSDGNPGALNVEKRMNNWIDESHIEDNAVFENGKYNMILHKDGSFEILRHGEAWLKPLTPNVPSKMLIGVLYEVLALRKLLDDIQFDFNPDKGELGPKCGPEMLEEIKKHIQHYGELR